MDFLKTERFLHAVTGEGGQDAIIEMLLEDLAKRNHVTYITVGYGGHVVDTAASPADADASGTFTVHRKMHEPGAKEEVVISIPVEDTIHMPFPVPICAHRADYRFVLSLGVAARHKGSISVGYFQK